MVFALFFLSIACGGKLVAGEHVHFRHGSGVTFYGKAADRVVQLLSDSCKCKKGQVRTCKTTRPSDCRELDKRSCRTGVYTIYPDDSPGFKVFCEMDKDGGGWTVIQRRQDGSVNFYRNWATYKSGFGSLKGEFWLGNEHIYQISSQGSYTLRIDMEDFDSNTRYAKYSKFSVGPESSGYKLDISGYSGNTGDGMKRFQNGQKFSTKDKDNDVWDSSCAEVFKGGWWYGDCHESNLNGLYLRGKHSSFADGVNWRQWKGHHYSLKSTTMMIRRR